MKGKLTEGNIETAKELMRGAEDLSQSTDPDIRRYLEHRQQHYGLPLYRKLEALKLGKTIQAVTHFKASTLAMRQLSSFDSDHLARDADPDQGDKTVVWIRCGVCAHPDTIRVDPAPLYEVRTGLYICRALACRACPSVTGKSGRWVDTREKCLTEALDTAIARNSTTMEKVRRNHKLLQ